MGVMLLELLTEGEQIGADAPGSKNVQGFRQRCADWSRKVEDYLKDDPVALARFRHAPPVPDAQAKAVPFGLATHWQRLKAQLAVLIELSREREQEEVIALSPTLWGVGVNLKTGWRTLKNWWRERRSLAAWV